ncbi:related to UNG1 - Uracil-DNA glycosylase [Melanopsichium pennsylvanicum]|uniref:Uracil-DNA glycosylase n=2 Tax=Melanopsichium pennsylvanicum TaxID=63383 RepID=A0AAJ5C5G1_9BASI|nr:related to UNG1-Uracil-DNA glycosylase [Melanopsichium pennsylvanicum 4]SNX84494.1 related to UNG1 - Uracil-DNA glycosylase [Melanopsichium pennsylvanicum]
MITSTTPSKRDGSTLSADKHDLTQHGSVKRFKTDTAPQHDEFDTSDQEFDHEALIAATDQAESAASNYGSSQPDPFSSSKSSTIKSSPSSTMTPSQPKVASSTTSTPRSSLRQTTLFSQSNGTKSTASSPQSVSAPMPKISSPSDPLSDPLWLERQTMSPQWFTLLRPEMEKPYFSTTLKTFLASENKSGQKTYPPPELIYSWSRLVPTPQHVRVVVLGQDPYHGAGQACGLSFSVPKGVAVPPSLKNIYKELAMEYAGEFEVPKHGCLDGWARQGVLMLNACLTVSAGAAASHHGKGWEGLTKHVLKNIADEAAGSNAAKKANANAAAGSKIASMFAKVEAKANTDTTQPKHGTEKCITDSTEQAEEERKKDEHGKHSGGITQTQCKGVVFLVWGAPAAKTLSEAGVTDKTPNILILKSPHPSPLSAHRGFLGNGHFKKANEWLKQRYGEQGMIDWSKL